ncbi:MAG: class I SAM-dependent methyltransferase [Planctomycetota bacterium]
MPPLPLFPYQHPSNHANASDIIRQHSTNQSDIREVALQGLDLSFASNILDLGCGFGFMTESFARRVSPGARFVGVDAWAANERPFLDKVETAGRRGEFVCKRLRTELPWPDRSFDVVVCSFSLYFFVEILPEVSRVLSENGLFLTVAHSEHHIEEDLKTAGFPEGAPALLDLIRRFSAENGGDILARAFGKIKRIDYANSLRFRADQVDDLLAYIRFKLPLMVPGADSDGELPVQLVKHVRSEMAARGFVAMEKNDAVFQCWSPICP